MEGLSLLASCEAQEYGILGVVAGFQSKLEGCCEQNLIEVARISIHSGPLIPFAPWSLGLLVPWSLGPLVSWSLGPLAPWPLGPLVPETLGPLVIYSLRPLVLVFFGLWFFVPLVPASLVPLVT